MADEPDPPIGRVGNPFEIPTVFEGGDELAHRLVGHPCSRRKFGQTGATGVHILEDRVEGGIDVPVAGCLEPRDQFIDHELSAPADQGDDGSGRLIGLVISRGLTLDNLRRHPA